MKKYFNIKILPVVLFAVFLWYMLPVSGSQPIYQQTQEQTEQSYGKNGAAATAHPLATKAAYEILKMGGNAVDAAVAAAFAIGVVEPDGSGIGGGGAMVIYLAKEKKYICINYYQKASEKVNDLNFQLETDRKNVKSITVPGTVAGLTKALEKYGTLPLSKVLEPAIRYAENGYPIDGVLASILLDNNDLLLQYPSTSNIFLKEGFPLMEGDTLVQKDLANTLKLIAEKGRNGFYEGETAEAMVKDITEAGGTITLADLKNFEAEESLPVHGTYRGYDIITPGAPQSGISVIEALNILEKADIKSMGHFSKNSETAHLLAEVLRRAYADRSAMIGDPHFNYVPVNGLISKDFAEERFNEINQKYADPKDYRKTKNGNAFKYDDSEKQSSGVQKKNGKEHFSDDDDDEGASIKSTKTDNLFDNWGKKKVKTVNQKNKQKAKETDEEDNTKKVKKETEYDGHTTHLCVVDKDGNMVSLTQTLGTFFGSGFVSRGVLFNSGMSNFSETTKINVAESGKQPRSSISPTIIMKDGKPFAVLGTPGATRIIATVTQLIVNLIDFNMTAEEANKAPRLFCQKFDDYLHLENRFTSETIDGLKAKGHNVKVYGDFDLFFGGAQIITYDPVTGIYQGSADSRRGGSAIGY